MTNKKAVVIEPHNDDLVIGIGGTVLQLISNGWDVTSVVISDGRYGNDENHTPEEIVSVRAAEKQAEREFIGVAGGCLGIPDLNLEERYQVPQHRETILEQLKEYLPTESDFVLFLPAGGEAHPDHQATYKFAQDLVLNAEASVTEVHYVVWEVPFYPERSESPGSVLTVGIDDEFERKTEAIKLHESQEKKQRYTMMVKRFNQYLSELYSHPEEHVEMVCVRGNKEQLLESLRSTIVTHRYHDV